MQAELDKVVAEFNEADAEQVKAIEAETNHDVKAIEYWLKRTLGDNAEVIKASEFIHFACTSEDINNLSHALMLKAGRDSVLLPALDQIINRMVELAHDLADRLQTPVFVLLDLDIGMNYRLCKPFQWDEARALYQEAATYCHSVKDYPSRDLFEQLMKAEEHHIDFLETQLDIIKRIGLELYTQKHIGQLQAED